MWVAAGARASRRSSYVGSSNKLASVLLLSTPAWLPKLYALTISFDEFDPTRFEGGTDFSDRFLTPAQFAVCRLQTSYRWFRYSRPLR